MRSHTSFLAVGFTCRHMTCSVDAEQSSTAKLQGPGSHYSSYLFNRLLITSTYALMRMDMYIFDRHYFSKMYIYKKSSCSACICMRVLRVLISVLCLINVPLFLSSLSSLSLSLLSHFLCTFFSICARHLG